MTNYIVANLVIFKIQTEVTIHEQEKYVTNQYRLIHWCYRSNLSFCVVTVNFGTSSNGGGKHGIEGSTLRLSPR